MLCNLFWLRVQVCVERCAMNGNGYLFAAYAITWVIHITYIGTILSRYARLKREIEQLKK
jgi:CcmD family protein